MTLPADVRRALDCYLDAIDRELPGYLQGLYLTGSLALDDYRPGKSDIDIVAVGETHPVGVGFDALKRAHARVRRQVPRPSLEGPYVTWDELADDPARASEGPQATHNRRLEHGIGDRHPVTWRTLAQCGVTVRGPEVDRLRIWTDPAVLRGWTLRNLDRYWGRRRAAGTKLLSKAGLHTLTPWETAWSVLGVTRLHYTLATGRITSKTGAGGYALRTFPDRYHRIVNEALRIRTGEARRSSYRDHITRRRDMLAYTGMVIDDAGRWRRRRPATWVA